METIGPAITEAAAKTAEADLGMNEIPEGGHSSFADRVHDLLLAGFLDRSRHVVDCPACGNLYISDGPGPRDYKRYREVPTDLRRNGDG